MRYKLTKNEIEELKSKYATLTDLENMRNDVRDAIDFVLQQIHDAKNKKKK